MPAQPIKIGIAGALGRMGQALSAIAAASDSVTVSARFDRPEVSGEGLVSVDAALQACDVIIDFTTGAASAALAERCGGRGGPALVIGATGISPDEQRRITAAAARIAIVQSGNYSLGINMLLGLVEQVARALPAEDWDIEVFEAHHRRKVDAPSGTALMLGQAAADGREVGLGQVARRTRDGMTGARPAGEIGFSVQRGGGIIGEHSVMFAGQEETLTISHSALDRGLFARGAVAAARWVAGRPPGLYDMRDVLGFAGKA